MINFVRILLDFLVSVSFNIIITLIIFAFILESVGTHAHQPIRKTLLRYIDPLLNPIHRIIPNYQNLDTGLLLLALLLELLKMVLLFLLAGQFPSLLSMFIWSILLLANAFVNFFLFAILFRVFISWVIPIYSNHPAAQLVFAITEPVLRPIRRLLPQHIKFDWSWIIGIVGLKVFSMAISYILILLNAPGKLL